MTPSPAPAHAGVRSVLAPVLVALGGAAVLAHHHRRVPALLLVAVALAVTVVASIRPA